MTPQLAGLGIRLLAVSMVVLLLPFGCFNPSYGAGGFLCGKGECPEGYACVEVDNPDEPGQTLDVCVADDSAGGEPQLTIRALDAEPSSNGNRVVLSEGETLSLSFDVTNFDFAPDKANTPPVDGEGHIHLHLDQTPPQGYLIPPGPVLELEIDLQIDDRFTVGEHTVIAALAQHNHQLVLPLVTAELRIRIVPEE